MTRLNLALLSVLLPAVLAFPHDSYRPSGGYHTGGPFATGRSFATGGPTAPYARRNTTIVTHTRTVIPTVVVSTVTVEPISVPTTTSENPTELVPSGYNNLKSPNVDSIDNGKGTPTLVSEDHGTCGPVTVTVTSRNTVTVTVKTRAQSKVSSHAASHQSSSSVTLHHSKGASAHSIGPDNTPVGSSTGLLPVSSSVSGHKHGVQHSRLHHKIGSSIKSNSKSVVTSETPLPSETTKPKVTTPKATAPKVTTPEASSASSSSVRENTKHKYLTTANPPLPEITSPVASEAPVPSSSKIAYSVPPVISHIENAAPSPKETPSSSASLEASSSPVYQVPSSTSAVSQPASSTPSTSNPGTKRGLVYNSADLTHSFSSSSAISWCYNWDSQPGGNVPSNFNFVPMMWGPIEVHTSNWNSNADSAIAKGSTHLLGFNEPDLPEQANLTPQQAAASWRTYLEPYAGKAKLGSPAVCNGGGLTGLNWLNSFFDACSGCTIDFVAIHWYGLANADGVADFKDHTAKAIAAAKGRPVWITEFKPDGSPEEMASFMTQILPFLDSTEGVERYSFFEVDGILVSGDSLTSLGSQYAA